MNRYIVAGLIILVIGWLIYASLNQPEVVEPVEESMPVNSEEESLLESQVGVEIPEEAEKIKLTGVDNPDLMGIATRNYADGEFEHSVIASLPEPAEGEFYEGWLVKNDDLFSTGKMTEKKGGWVLEYSSNEDKSSYYQVMVTLEETADNQPEIKILEGSF